MSISSPASLPTGVERCSAQRDGATVLPGADQWQWQSGFRQYRNRRWPVRRSRTSGPMWWSPLPLGARPHRKKIKVPRMVTILIRRPQSRIPSSQALLLIFAIFALHEFHLLQSFHQPCRDQRSATLISRHRSPAPYSHINNTAPPIQGDPGRAWSNTIITVAEYRHFGHGCRTAW